MKYRIIPGTDLQVAVLCMGGGPISREDNDAEVFELLDTFYTLGGTFFDSANIYGKWLPSGANVCDRNLGKWLRRTGLREKVVITSKGAHPPLDRMESPRLRAREVEQDLDESLADLGVDSIDLYYLHRDDPAMPVETIIDYLNRFVEKGKIRYFGSSNWAPARIAAAQDYAERTGQAGFAANQLMWSYAVPDPTRLDYPLMQVMDNDALGFHRESGLAAIGYEAQARGLFQKLDATGEIPESLRRVYGNPVNLDRYRQAKALSMQLGVKVGDVALAYLLNQDFPSFAVIGSRTPGQLRDSMTAADLQLTRKQVADLEV